MIPVTLLSGILSLKYMAVPDISAGMIGTVKKMYIKYIKKKNNVKIT